MKKIAIEQVKPNDWNPNRMTQEGFAELVAELQHLGKPAKPIVLRQNGKGYEIIDGEHTYRALIDLGHEDLLPGWYEIEQYDDFEAMRQTYKRNQHGTHDPLLQGELFQRMMADRDLSRREIAQEIEVSEGTIRNSLEYVEAWEMRNSYDDWKLPKIRRLISELSIRQVRKLNYLPVELGDLWLDYGADMDKCPQNYPRKSALYKLVPKMRCGPIKAVERLRQVKECLRLWGRRQKQYGSRGIEWNWVGGRFIDVDEAMPYISEFISSRWWSGWGTWDIHKLRNVLEAIARPEGDTPKIIVPFDRFRAWIDYPEPMNFADFRASLRATGEELGGPQLEGEQFWDQELANYAPANIRDAPLPAGDRYGLWQAQKTYEDEEIDKSLIQQALESAIAILIETQQQRDRTYSKLHPAEEIFENELMELLPAAKVEETLKGFGDKKEIIQLVEKMFTDRAQILAVFGKKGKAEKFAIAIQPLLDRLKTLQEPELALIAAMLLGRGDYLEIWARAVGWKFEPKDTVIIDAE